MSGDLLSRAHTGRDARLVALVRAGDEHAFELIVRRHRRSLLLYCRRLGLADGLAEDAVQQAFLSAWLALRRGDDVRELRAWLGRIAHNTAINILRRADGRITQELDSGLSETLARHGLPDPADRVAFHQALADVAALPHLQREALLLSAVDGRSYEEVASTLGVSPGAVRGLVHRARSALRSAAGALAPAPLVRWSSGAVRRAGAPAGSLMEAAAPATATGGTGTLLRGAVAAVTAAALLAGVAAGPLHKLVGGKGRHHATRGAALSTAPSGAGAGGGAASAGIASAGSGGTARPQGAPTLTPAAGATASSEGDAGGGGAGSPGGTGPGSRRGAGGTTIVQTGGQGQQQPQQASSAPASVPQASTASAPAQTPQTPQGGSGSGGESPAPPTGGREPTAGGGEERSASDDPPGSEKESETEKPGESDDAIEREREALAGGGTGGETPTRERIDD